MAAPPFLSGQAPPMSGNDPYQFVDNDGNAPSSIRSAQDVPRLGVENQNGATRGPLTLGDVFLNPFRDPELRRIEDFAITQGLNGTNRPTAGYPGSRVPAPLRRDGLATESYRTDPDFIAGRRFNDGVDTGLGLDELQWLLLTTSGNLFDVRELGGVTRGETDRRLRPGPAVVPPIQPDLDPQQEDFVTLDIDLHKDDVLTVLAHEVGHILDRRLPSPTASPYAGANTLNFPVGAPPPAAGIDIRDLSYDFLRLHNEIRNPALIDRRRQGLPLTSEVWEAPDVRNYGPWSLGYIPGEVRDELVAEALAMYMTNPGWLKSNYPDVRHDFVAWSIRTL